MKKKAFTLTELLVVVVIIGVLSAVVLPKFTKVLQTRKTTEAENIMAAVRNEQEARCMVGRDYVGQNEIGKLASLPKATSKNYTYTLDAQGITATAKDGNYTLQIPSYTDGRICCSGAGCDGLNKDYPKCDSFTPEQATCEVPIPCTGEDCGENQEQEPECSVPSQTTETKTETCGCNGAGTKTGTRTFDSESCSWSDWAWTECTEKETECSCTEGKERQGGTCNTCGHVVERCESGSWVSKGCSVQHPLECEACPEGISCGSAPSLVQSCGCDGIQSRIAVCTCSEEMVKEYEEAQAQAAAEAAGRVVPDCRVGDEECQNNQSTQTDELDEPRTLFRGTWKMTTWGECNETPDASCENICDGVAKKDRVCTPGESRQSPTKCTSLLIFPDAGATVTNTEWESAATEGDTNLGTVHNYEHTPRITYPTEEHCTKYCEWDRICPAEIKIVDGTSGVGLEHTEVMNPHGDIAHVDTANFDTTIYFTFANKNWLSMYMPDGSILNIKDAMAGACESATFSVGDSDENGDREWEFKLDGCNTSAIQY